MRPKVLIVEDERVIAEHLQEMLDSFGYDVIGIVATGDKAIEIAKKNRPDVVLMDIRINASLNGVETAVCLQGIYEDPVPILFVTAYSVEDFPVIKAVHPYAVLKKPFTEQDVSSTLQQVWANLNAS